MIEAEPNTGWLYGSVKLGSKGFILTGGSDGFDSSPYASITPGADAVGDVRANSVKRVASAVGADEGKLRPLLSERHFPTKAITSAHAYVEASVLGKVVVDVQ